MKHYKLKPELIGNYARRTEKKGLRILIPTLVFTEVFIVFGLRDSLNEPDVLFSIVAGMFLMLLIVWLIVHNNRKFLQLSGENFVITIDDHSITRTIDLENEQRLNFLHKSSYSRAKNISAASYHTEVNLNRLESAEKKDGNLVIKEQGYSSMTGRGMITVPQEIEGFEEIETLVRSKLR